MKKVLVIGSGGRCHAIVDALHRSPSVDKIYCAPGNPGIAQFAELVPIKETEIEALCRWARDNSIDLTVVGPEIPLSMGIVDYFRKAGLKIFGHTQKATEIESSKEFAKEIMKQAGVPTAAYTSFSDYNKARDYVMSHSLPVVIKYDGLAAGKGVVIANTADEADAALKEMLLENSFGTDRVIIEEYLEGPEFSFMCFVSGTQVEPMPVAQDHKRAFDGDKGPNTGGMGAYTSLPFISEEDRKYSLEKILKPVAAKMAELGCPLSGVLYGGLMKTKDGIKVIEFNARFGDPETEVILPMLESDIYKMFEAVATGSPLPEMNWKDETVFGVVLASNGYPGAYKKGFEIEGLADVDTTVYHMGTAIKDDRTYTGGGRVLMVVARDKDVVSARDKVYKEIAKIKCEGLFYRKDIGHQALDAIKNDRILDGRKTAKTIKEEVRKEIEVIKAENGRIPRLAVVLVGENAASKVYVQNKVKSCEYTGIQSVMVKLPQTVSEKELLEVIEGLNKDPEVDGVLVQLPLPETIDEDKIINAIDPTKDVDGFHPLNVAELWNGDTELVPCTPKGIMYLLKENNIDPEGKLAVVIGRSNIVGKPMAKLLLDANATVVIAHSRTKDLEKITKQADILVAAVGRPRFVDSRHVKPGATVIDVGINRDAEGKLCGDVDFDDVLHVASKITPVPGGVGVLTTAMLLKNTIYCYKLHTKKEK